MTPQFEAGQVFLHERNKETIVILFVRYSSVYYWWQGPDINICNRSSSESRGAWISAGWREIR